MDPLQWMGAVRMRVQTADKNTTISNSVIRTTPIHQVTSCEVKKLFFNIFTIKTFWTSIRCFQLKCESSILNIAFFSENVVSSESGEKYAHIKHRLQAKAFQNNSKQICGWILIWEDRIWTFSLEEALLEIITFTFTFMHLADTFIQSDLQCIQVIHFWSVRVFSGNWTHNLCAANAMLYHWNTEW